MRPGQYQEYAVPITIAWFILLVVFVTLVWKVGEWYESRQDRKRRGPWDGWDDQM